MNWTIVVGLILGALFARGLHFVFGGGSTDHVSRLGLPPEKKCPHCGKKIDTWDPREQGLR